MIITILKIIRERAAIDCSCDDKVDTENNERERSA